MRRERRIVERVEERVDERGSGIVERAEERRKVENPIVS